MFSSIDLRTYVIKNLQKIFLFYWKLFVKKIHCKENPDFCLLLQIAREQQEENGNSRSQSYKINLVLKKLSTFKLVHYLIVNHFSWQIWSTLDRPFTNTPQALLFYHGSIKLLISATLFSLPTPLLKHFHFTIMLHLICF